MLVIRSSFSKAGALEAYIEEMPKAKELVILDGVMDNDELVGNRSLDKSFAL